MFSNLIFELPRSHDQLSKPSIFLIVAAGFTACYLVFALLLVGVTSLSRGGGVFAVFSFLWVILGVAAGKFKFPMLLLLPLFFYFLMIVSGLIQGNFSLDYAGQLTTIWIGSLAVAVFIANGVSIKMVMMGLLVVVVGNVVAILVGYDAYLINVQEYSQIDLDNREQKRSSGIAGQPNLLVSLVFALPFLVFALRRKQSVWLYIGLVGLCVFMMYATASRTTIVFTLLFVVCGAFFLIKNILLRGLLGIGIGLVIFVVVSFLSDPLALSKIENSPFGEIYIVKRAILSVDQEVGESQSIRTELATNFWEQFYVKPTFGYGPNQFSKVSGDGFYAHNNFAEIAINWGIIGLAMYYVMYAVIIFGIVKYFPINFYLLAPLAFLALADFAFVSFIERALVLILCLLLLASHNVMSQDRTSRSKSGRRRRRRV